MSLSAQKVKAAKSGRLGGERGFFLYVKASASRTLILRYQVQGKRRDLGLGAYPDLTPAMARERTAEARQLIAKSKPPT